LWQPYRRANLQPRKVLEDAQTNSLRLLRMELRRPDLPMPDRSAELAAISRSRAGDRLRLRFSRLHVVAVNKIDRRLLIQPRKQRILPPPRKRVPPHVRNLDPLALADLFLKSHHLAAKQRETRH